MSEPKKKSKPAYQSELIRQYELDREYAESQEIESEIEEMLGDIYDEEIERETGRRAGLKNSREERDAS